MPGLRTTSTPSEVAASSSSLVAIQARPEGFSREAWATLADMGILGAGGGYILARSSSQVTVGEIVVTVEEPLSPLACMDEGSAVCVKVSRCVTHNVWKGLGERIRGFLDDITLEDLTDEARSRGEEMHG